MYLQVWKQIQLYFKYAGTDFATEFASPKDVGHINCRGFFGFLRICLLKPEVTPCVLLCSAEKAQKTGQEL